MQVVDIFTKPLAQTRFVQLCALLGVKDIVLEEGKSQFSSIFSYLCFDNFVHGYLSRPCCKDPFLSISVYSSSRLRGGVGVRHT